jgi:hypothetical protein
MAGAELIKEHATMADYREVFSDEQLAEFGIEADPGADNGVAGVPDIDGSFHVSGIQALMRNNECLGNLKEIFVPLVSKQTPFSPYLKPYNILKSVVIRTNLTDENIMVTDEEAALIAKNIAAAQEAAAKKAQEAEELAEAQAALDLADRMDSGRQEGIANE